MQKLIKNHGSNDLVDCLLWGEMTLDEVTNETIQAWLSAVQQTSTNTTLSKRILAGFQGSKRTHVILSIQYPLFHLEGCGT